MSSDVLYVVKGPKTLFEMTWKEVSEMLKKTDIVIIPVGSTEQHGTHLPLGSDSFQATDLTKMVAEKLHKKGITIAIAPTIPFGISPHHMKFPGSITLSVDTLLTILKEVCGSLHHHGFRRFVLLLGHGGNLNTLNLAADYLSEALPDTKFIVPDWLPINSAEYQNILESERPIDEHHSGEGETSRMMFSTPNLVLLKEAEPYYVPDEIDPYRTKPYRGSVHTAEYNVGMREWTTHGVMGDPRKAKKKTGEYLYDVTSEWLSQVIEYEFPA